MEKVVTRFAPSPTGLMHIGGVRTALFAYLMARKHGGTFILRIEDTDKERQVDGSIEHIQAALRWLGLDWDYGPDKPGPFGSCIQSERLGTYKKFALDLIAKGYAYPDPYTEAEVEAFRKRAEAEKRPFLFRDHRPAAFEPWDGTKPLRLKVPEVKRWHWRDAVRGDLEAGEEMLDDFVLVKSDGYPTYNFAHIIDDHLMGVTHILRADEFISSTPRFLSLYQALGIEPPVFATLPPILRPDRTKKLGKRDGAKDVMEYKTEGYLPEALANYLALLGWHPSDDREVMSMDEILAAFTLDRIQHAGAVFDDEKLNWFNHEYVKRLDDAAFLSHAAPYLPEWLSTKSSKARAIAPILRDKIAAFGEIPGLFGPAGELHFAGAARSYPAEMLLWKKNPDRAAALAHLTECRRLLELLAADSFTADAAKAAIWPYAESKGRGDVLWPLRVALTGQEKSPDPFASAAILGKDEALRRIDAAIALCS